MRTRSAGSRARGIWPTPTFHVRRLRTSPSLTGLAQTRSLSTLPGLNIFKGRVVTQFARTTHHSKTSGSSSSVPATSPDVAADASRTAPLPSTWSCGRRRSGWPATRPSSRRTTWKCGSCSCCRVRRLVAFALPLTTTRLLGYLTGIDPPGADTFSLNFLELHLKSLFFLSRKVALVSALKGKASRSRRQPLMQRATIAASGPMICEVL